MLKPDDRLVIFAEGAMGEHFAKMAEGILRYSPNPVTAVVDSTVAGRSLVEVCGIDRPVPLMADLDSAIALGADALVLGIAPSGGRVPDDWWVTLDAAVDSGLSLVNGLHDRLGPRYAGRLSPGRWVWDVREPVGEPPRIAAGRAAQLDNTRVVMVGTDMAVGKMTSGLEVTHALIAAGHDARFLATGQTGLVIAGDGIPLDAHRVDHAAGAVERMVLEHAEHDVVVIEGQGSLAHPGSTATLPLLRGSCATKMVLCHRVGMTEMLTAPGFEVPPLNEMIELCETVARAGGALTRAKVVAVCLDTRGLDADAARAECDGVSAEVGLPATDVVRFDAMPIAEAIVG